MVEYLDRILPGMDADVAEPSGRRTRTGAQARFPAPEAERRLPAGRTRSGSLEQEQAGGLGHPGEDVLAEIEAIDDGVAVGVGGAGAG